MPISLKGEVLAFNVRETLQLTREGYRYARNWKAAHLLEVGSHDNGLGLPKGDYHIERVFENGRVQLRDMRGRKHRVEPSKIDPNGKLNRLKLSRSEEHTSELQSLMRISYAGFCLKNKNKQIDTINNQY